LGVEDRVERRAEKRHESPHVLDPLIASNDEQSNVDLRTSLLTFVDDDKPFSLQ
jgi:hypothetical protein